MYIHSFNFVEAVNVARIVQHSTAQPSAMCTLRKDTSPQGFLSGTSLESMFALNTPTRTESSASVENVDASPASVNDAGGMTACPRPNVPWPVGHNGGTQQCTVKHHARTINDIPYNRIIHVIYDTPPSFIFHVPSAALHVG